MLKMNDARDEHDDARAPLSAMKMRGAAFRRRFFGVAQDAVPTPPPAAASIRPRSRTADARHVRTMTTRHLSRHAVRPSSFAPRAAAQKRKRVVQATLLGIGESSQILCRTPFSLLSLFIISMTGLPTPLIAH